MGDSIESVKQLLRSVLLSSKAGVKASRLQNDYQELCGGYIPHTKFGFSSLHDFIVSINDVVRVGRNSDNELTYYAVADSSTQHIQALVSKQKSKAKPKKKAPPSFRRNMISSKPAFRPSFNYSRNHQPTKKKYSPAPTKKPSMHRSVSNKENVKSESRQSSKYSSNLTTTKKNMTLQQTNPKSRSHSTSSTRSVLSSSKNTTANKDFPQPKKSVPPNNTFTKSYGRQNSAKGYRSNAVHNRDEFKKQLPPRFAKKALATVFSEIALYDNPLSSPSDVPKPEPKKTPARSRSADFASNVQDEIEEDLENWNSNQKPIDIDSQPDDQENWNSNQEPVDNQPEELVIPDHILDNLKKLLSIYECGLHLSGLPNMYKETFSEDISSALLEKIASGDIPGYVSVEKVNIAGNSKCILFPYVDRQIFNEATPVAVFVDAHEYLIMGREYEVQVTFAASCDKVYVQLVSESDIKEEMKTLIEDKFQMLPVSRMIKPGSYVITEDYFRAKVLSVNKKQLEIYRIDYEDCTASYWTSMENVRHMLPAIADYPEFCILCKMHRPAHETSSKWLPESAQEFSDSFANVPLVLKTIAISSIKSQNTTASQYEHTVIFYKVAEQYKCNINVRLIEEEHAIQNELTKHTDPFEHQPSTYASLPNEEICELFVFNASCTTEIEVCIIGVGFSDKLVNLENAMFDFYSNAKQDFNLPSPPPCGCIYAVLAEATCTRGKLLSVSGEECTVYLVDNGETEVVSLKSLRPLDQQFVDFPMQSISVSLAWLEHEPLSTHFSILQKLSETVLYKSCPARIVMRSDGSSKDTRHIVELFCPGETSVISVNQLCLDLIIEDDLTPTLPGESGFTAVSVSHVDLENSIVFVRLAGDGMVKLKACLSALEYTFDCDNILPSQKVVSIYPEKLCLVSLSNGLFRARIQKLIGDEKVKVYLVDVGAVKDVAIDCLLKLDDETTLTIPSQAISCKLSAEANEIRHRSLGDVASAISTLPVLMRVDKLSEDGSPDLVSMWTDDHSYVQIVAHDCATNCIVTSNGPKLVCKSNSVGDDASITSKSQSSVSEDFKPGRTMSPASVEAFSTSSSMSDLKQIPSPVSFGSGDAANTGTGSSPLKPVQNGFENIYLIADFMYVNTQLEHYREVLSLKQNPFLVKVEDVISPDYIQLIALEKLPSRGLLTTALTSFYEEKRAKIETDFIAAGETYAFCASSENCYYRVRVLSMMDDKISIYLYDYGECRVTSKKCLKVLAKHFKKIPEYIITAKLSGIRPLKEDKNVWPNSISEKVCNMLKGKCYFAHVLKIIRSDALLKRDVWEVCLCDTSTQDLWINDILVDEWRCANYVE